MNHNIYISQEGSPSYEYVATCSCGWTCSDPTLPWLEGYARQHAERA